MDIQEIIDGITTSECVNCKFGKALIALKDLRDAEGNEVSQPVAQRNAAPQSKLQKKTAVSKTRIIKKSSGVKECNGCGKTKAIDDFPTNKQCVGGHAGTCKTCIYDRAKKRAAAKKSGKQPATHSEKSSSIPSSANPGIIRCKLCDYRAIDEARLSSHMRTNHGGVGA
jgi:hypothetical protein